MNFYRSHAKIDLDDEKRATIESMITKAINDSPFKWRTAEAIAKQIKFDVVTVNKIMKTSSSFVRSKRPNARGKALYTTAARYRSETPFWERVAGAAANTVAE